jgi:hypothetical protein
VRRLLAGLILLLGLVLPGLARAQESPTIVRVGAYINDVQQLDLQSHSYAVDMYLWFRWCDKDLDPSRTFEFLNSFELWGHILTYETEAPEPRPNGCFYQGLRNQGKFNTKLPLADYPFDEQELTVELEDAALDSSQLRYVPDYRATARNPDMTLPGYDLGKPKLEIISQPYATQFGERGAEFPSYSRARFVLAVTRPAATYSVKLLLPIIIVLISAALMFIVRPDFFEGRIGIGITALLTLVALQLTTNSALPEVNYLLMIDKIYIASYAFIVASLALVARTSWLVGDANHAVRFDRRSLVFVAGGYLLVLALIVGLQLS